MEDADERSQTDQESDPDVQEASEYLRKAAESLEDAKKISPKIWGQEMTV
jgi:hypothetical protein